MKSKKGVCMPFFKLFYCIYCIYCIFSGDFLLLVEEASAMLPLQGLSSSYGSRGGGG